MDRHQKIEFYKKRPFSDKINAVVAFLRQSNWSYLKAQLFITGPVLLLVNILLVQSSQELFDIAAISNNPENLLADMLNSYGVAIIISLISSALLPSVTFSYMSIYETEPVNEIQVGQVWRKTIRTFPSILAFMILVSIIGGILAFLGTLMFASMGVFGALFGLFLGGLGMLAVIVTFSLGMPSIGFENNNPISAFSRSQKLIRGKWFSTLGILAITLVIAMLINGLFGFPRSIMYMIWTFNSVDSVSGTFSMSDMPAHMQVLDIFFAVIATFGTLISYSLVYIALSFQFFNLVERQESRGLMAQISDLNSENSADEEDETY